MLKAIVRWLWPPEAPRTQREPVQAFITREELDRELAKFEERQAFEFGEWYDKFSALHARTEKRVNRDRKANGNGSVAVEQPLERPTVLAFRKPWSV